jgi:hypothetical protein
MRDRLLIFAGLFLFVALFTFPMWRGVLAGTTARQPELKLPIAQKTCVLPRAQMRQQHIQLLMKWREGARNGYSSYTAYDGKRYEVNLSKTCITQCHNNTVEFCDRCHQFTAVSEPNCFDCHVDPAATASATRVAEAIPAASDTPVFAQPRGALTPTRQGGRGSQ